MAISQGQVEEACENIQRFLEAFRSDPKRVTDLQRALAALQWLRGQYQQNKALLEGYVERLREYGRQLQQSIGAARETLVGEYLRASQVLVAWEQVREACRDALAELARAEGAERFDSPEGWVGVRQVRVLSLPKSGTPQREELSGLITQAGRWADVAHPSGPRLLKALDDGLFPATQAARISQLCPVQTVCRLSAHPRPGDAERQADPRRPLGS